MRLRAVFHISMFTALLLGFTPGALHGQAAPPQSEPASPPVAFRSSARAVLLNVVVTDDKGNPVTGLTKDQFHVAEDHQPQTVNFFEPHTSLPASTTPVTLPPMPPGVYTNFPVSPVTGSLNVLLLDAVNTEIQDQGRVRKEMISFLKTAPPGARMAIFTLGSHLRFIQGFTDDTSALVAALNTRGKGVLYNSALLDPMRETPQQLPMDVNNTQGTHSITQAVEAVQAFEAEDTAYQDMARARITLDAMDEIARYLSGFPGRKNLIWFSSSFPVNIFPDPSLQSTMDLTTSFADEIRTTSNLLTLSQVAVYPIDSRGLQGNSAFDPSVAGSAYVSSPAHMGDVTRDSFYQTNAEHTVMNQIADQTGGKALYNTNGLKEALARVIHDGSNYYTIAYSPTNRNENGKLRRIEIHVEGGRYHLSYRNAYFAEKTAKPSSPAQAAPSVLTSSMMRGLPDATQIIFKLRALPADPQPPSRVLVLDNAGVKGPLTRYALDYAADLHSLTFTQTPDGIHHGNILVEAVAYNEDGKPLNTLGKSLAFDLSPADYARFSKVGLLLHEDFDLPRGEVFLRTGLIDTASGRVGTVEIPLQVSTGGERASK